MSAPQLFRTIFSKPISHIPNLLTQRATQYTTLRPAQKLHTEYP